MPKIVCISDTHNQLSKVTLPKGDWLIHSGGLTGRGSFQEMARELVLLGKIGKDYKNVIFIAGNHDRLGENAPGLVKELCQDNGIVYLDHSYIEIDGLRIFGSPYTPAFNNWAFQLYGEEGKEKWAQIPDNIDILITHGPPYGILDTLKGLECLGSRELYDKVQELKGLKLHVFGHVHDGYGKIKIGNTVFVNASVCTEQYEPINKPFVITI